MKKRCPWLNLHNPEYVDYHDKEWGVPVKDDQKLFECLIFEGAQAGLSWETVLKKRKAYLDEFEGLEIKKMSKLSESKIKKAMGNPGIIRNRLKIESIKKNALGVMNIQKECGSFSKYLWDFVGGTPIVHYYKKLEDYPSSDELSQIISKDLKKHGFSFVGPTIIYAFLQAVGVYNDHSVDCFCHPNQI